jgi:NADPH:quinone reductase-like Zn-dependent oxidoreductase
MKAAIRSTYGTAEVLSIKEVEKPTPRDNELLVRVYAATANRTDCHILWGKPFIMRMFTGLFKPRLAITGTDFAGQIEATGKDVKSFKAGDKVMGFEFLGLRSHAYYLTIPETKAIIMPGNITYDHAVACVEGAFYALAVINKVNPKAGQKALVIGATGAIGSSSVQFLKFFGASVNAVCSGENSELVKSLGADKIIDYKTDDFTKDPEQYDFVFDAVGKSTFAQCKPLLREKGIYSSSGGSQNLLLPFITPLLGGKKVVFAPPGNLKASLDFILDLVEKKSFRPVIDRKYPLDKIAEAFTYVATGQKIGNVIITMDA